jgi:hypothetical protein
MKLYILLFFIVFISLLIYVSYDFKYFENFLNINSSCSNFCRNVGKDTANNCSYFNNMPVKCLNNNNQLVNANCFYNNRNQCVYKE